MSPRSAPSAAARHLSANRAELVRELAEWLRVPSVAGAPEHEIDVLRSVNWLRGTLSEIGFPTVEMWSANAVHAEWCAAPGAPTVLVYSHHDVRAAKDGTWEQTAAFEPVLREGRLYGRGASDAKGQVLAHLWGLRTHLAVTGRAAPAVTVKVLVEGEEETGSASLSDLLDEHGVTADLVVFSDTLLWHAEHPAVCLGLRGLVLAQIEVYGPRTDIHSGAVSGPAPNSAVALAGLLARLHDDKGRITLPGFYDDVTEPTEQTRAELAALPYSDEDWLERSHTRSIGGEEGFTVLERLWARPAAEVISLESGTDTGPSRGAIPAVATATISIRTAAGQRAEKVAEQVRRWVADALDDRVDHQLTVGSPTDQEPYRTPRDHPAVAALAEAMEAGFGRPVGRMGNAGGGPAELLARKTGAPVIFFGTGLPEDNWHDGDESVSIDVLLAGAATLAELWPRLALLDESTK
ncbi:M20/M25/M40 family metallo-hydrolase [Symbioplanes lichenis]|uniref:M20/M25/M40 family metallo-hydrolase n=1 Tax=Symbioplanes lichenis TaxID=1629072 RepID=UPI002739B675|nr:M20/M25/M40 family metallo-hydrolase [Actinoplanes lichenis]